MFLVCSGAADPNGRQETRKGSCIFCSWVVELNQVSYLVLRLAGTNFILIKPKKRLISSIPNLLSSCHSGFETAAPRFYLSISVLRNQPPTYKAHLRENPKYQFIERVRHAMLISTTFHPILAPISTVGSNNTFSGAIKSRQDKNHNFTALVPDSSGRRAA